MRWSVLVLVALSQSLIAQTPSGVTVFSSPNSSVYGAAVAITATVTPSAATGSVTFYDGTSVLGIGPVSGGQALFTTRLLNTGVRILHAHYSGDGTYSASDSASVPQTVASNAAKSFQPALAYAANLGLNSIAAADFNLDGKTDLVVCDYLANSLVILLGNGNGTFQAPITYSVPSPASVAVGDLNGDGVPDLVTDSGNGITVWIGNRNGTFTEGNSYSVVPPQLVSIADFNGDGQADVLVASGFNLQVWLGNGDGTLTAKAPQSLPGNGSPAFAIGDFNGDGKADVASMGYTAAGNSFVVLLGNGDGTFAAASNPANASANGTMIAAADLNGDGKLDLVLATNNNSISVLIGNGDGTFQPAVKYAVGTVSYAVAIADFNGDGIPDLCVVDQFDGQVSVLPGKGNGTFGAPVSYAVGPAPSGMALGDFNGDGEVDVAVPTAAGAGVLLGQAAAAPTVEDVSVSPSSGAGVAQSFVFQFSDTAGAADISSMSVMFGAAPASLANACVVTYTRSTNSFSLLTNSGQAGNSLPSGGAPGSILTNSQCSVDAGQSSAAVFAGNNQQLSVSVAFATSFAGARTIYAVATSSSGATTGWQPLGTWTVSSTVAIPQTVSVDPSSGAGTSQSFLFTYFDSNGPGDLDSVEALIGTSTNAAASCLVLVQPALNRVWLTNDAGGGWVGFNLLGSAGSLNNSQCTVNVSASSAGWSGNTFTVSLSLVFASAYSGAKTIYADAAGLTGSTSGWQLLGTWTVGSPPPPPSFLTSTLAGAAVPPTPMPATSAMFRQLGSAATDPAGNLYFSDGLWNLVFRVDSTGTLTRVAGTGVGGYSGDNGPALNAQLSGPTGLAIDSAGNLFIGDMGNSRVRRVSRDGTIVTVAGNGGSSAASGDGGPAMQATVPAPAALAVDASGNLFIADTDSNTVRKVSAGIITTVAGNGVYGISSDGIPATEASLAYPAGLAVDASGNLFIADSSSQRVRKLSGGVLTTVAGNGTYGYTGDGGPATGAELDYPEGLAFDTAGNLYLADMENQRVRKVTPGGIITTIAGSGAYGYKGDGEGATLAELADPISVAVDALGNLYIVDSVNFKIRKVSGGIISTLAGASTEDAPTGPQETFVSPWAVVKDASGNLYVSDPSQVEVHRIPPSGPTSVMAGTGAFGYSGENLPASSSELKLPQGLAIDSSGALYIADYFNLRVFKVSNGSMATVAGNGGYGYSGDGGTATSASLGGPTAVAVDSSGNLYIADPNNSCVRKVSSKGIITTVAGTGTPGYSADGVPATSSELNAPVAVAADSAGNLYIADLQNYRIRKVDTRGIITTVAGNGVSGQGGDGGPATQASLDWPSGIAVDPAGNLYMLDYGRIRMVTAGGMITTIGSSAGNSSIYPPPTGVFADSSGNVYVADMGNRVIRLLTPQGGPPVLGIASSHTGSFALGSTGQYTLTVSNASGAGPTNGTVTVTEFPPTGMTLSMSGAGWGCAGAICTRGDPLAAGTSYPTIDAQVSILSNGPSQATNQVTVAGGGAALVGAQDFTILAAPATTIQTSPAGLQFSVDNLAAQSAPQTLLLPPGPHSVAVSSPQSGGPGTQYVFTSWSDFGGQTHTIDVTAGATNYVANFQTQYQVTTSVMPAASGSVTPLSGVFLDAGLNVTLTATAAAPYLFSYWSGAISGNSNPATLSLTAASAAVAHFVSADVNHDGLVSVSDVQRIVNEVLGTMSPIDDLDDDGIVDVADIQRLLNAVLGSH